MMGAMKPDISLAPAAQWNSLHMSHADLVAVASRWETDDVVPESIADMLATSRALFEHGYFVYEFLVVALTWSFNALEAALRDALQQRRGKGEPATRALVGRAQAQGWLSKEHADRLRSGTELRNRLVHTAGAMRVTPALAAEVLANAHADIAHIYREAAKGPRGPWDPSEWPTAQGAWASR
jgi:uncharacterized protein YutE (UPF0331/DUF86 family)